MKKLYLLIKKALAVLFARAELIFWVAALVLLFFMDTEGSSLCFFTWIGFGSCPGCGLGHAIHSALQLDIARSFAEHPLGIPAICIIVHRIKQLFSIKTKTAI